MVWRACWHHCARITFECGWGNGGGYCGAAMPHLGEPQNQMLTSHCQRCRSNPAVGKHLGHLGGCWFEYPTVFFMWDTFFLDQPLQNRGRPAFSDMARRGRGLEGGGGSASPRGAEKGTRPPFLFLENMIPPVFGSSDFQPKSFVGFHLGNMAPCHAVFQPFFIRTAFLAALAALW